MPFTRMDQSTREDWMHIADEVLVHQESVPQRILGHLRALGDVYTGFGVSQLHHSLQTATMAERAGASEEMVLVALCHDIGKVMSVYNHGAIGAEVLRPYVSDEAYHILRTHQDFQGRYYYDHFGLSTGLRQQHAKELWYEQACQFSDEWDQAAFDPDYDVEPLEHFEPLVVNFFKKPRGI